MDRRDKVWIVALFILGALGTLTFVRLQDRAFPIASLDFELSRDEAFLKAQDFAVSMGHDLTDYRGAQTFGYDQAAQIFLQKTLGLEAFNALVRDWVSVWSWKVRWFKPLQKEEIRINADPGGRIVQYDHDIMETDVGANLGLEAARTIANSFVTDVVRFDLADWEAIESSSEVRKARTDHTFTLRKRGWKIGDDGHYRIRVIVRGDRVGSYREFPFVPESFHRDYLEIRSRANLLTQTFSVGWLALGIAVLVLVARGYRSRTLPYRNAIIVLIAVAVAMVIMVLNSWPLIRYSYPTTQSYPTYIGVWIASSLFVALAYGGIIGLTGAAGQRIGRETLGFAAMPTLSLRGVMAGRLTKSTLIGYGLAGFHLGYVVLFYLIGSKFGVWAPAELQDYSETFSTIFPWIYPLVIGLVASTSEEFFFRLVAICLLIRWTGKRWLAVLAPAVVWAFLHSNYPMEPIYTRGVELTIVGCIFGIVFLRWGVWATVVSHYAFNAFLMAFPMMNSSSLYFRVSGAAVVLLLALPLLLAVYGWATGRVATDEDEEEPVRPLPPTSPTSDQPAGLEPVPTLAEWRLDSDQRWMSLAAIVVGAAMMVGFKTVRFGESTFEVTVDRGRAIALADSVRVSLGWELEGSRVRAEYYDALGRDDHTFLVRERGIANADSLVHAASYPRRWEVHWFKPLEKTEFIVGISTSGEVAFIRRQLPEGEVGATISKEEALKVSGAFLISRFGVDVSNTARYRLVESVEDKKENRLDHRIVWERSDLKVGDGEFRLFVEVQGDDIGAVMAEFKAPEPFIRAYRERTPKDGVLAVAMALFVAGTVILAGISFLRLYQAGDISWRRPIWVAVVLGVCTIAGIVNDLPSFFSGFNTSQTLGTHIGSRGLQWFVQLATMSVFVAVITALGIGLFREALPDQPDPGSWLLGLVNGEVRGRLLLDSVLGGVALFVLTEGVASLRTYVKVTWFLEYLNARSYSISSINSYLQFGDAWLDAILQITSVFVLVVVALVWKRTLRGWPWVVVLGLAVYSYGQIDLAKEFVHGVVIVGVTVLQGLAGLGVLVYVVRTNVLAYLFTITLVPLLSRAGRLFDADLFSLDVSGALVALLAVSPILYSLLTLKSEDRT